MLTTNGGKRCSFRDIGEGCESDCMVGAVSLAISLPDGLLAC